jgi:uncharacterized membrane protein YecN with MAPEG domain
MRRTKSKFDATTGRMTWYVWLIAAALLAAFAAVTGIQPKGARPIARTGLMSVARFVLVLMILICVYFAYRAGTGG